MSLAPTMKRPWPIYFIAVWCFVAFAVALEAVFWLLNRLLPEGQPFLDILRGAASIAIIWHVVRLAQLRSFNRWLSVVVFFWEAIMTSWNAFALADRLTDPGRVLPRLGLFVALNIACGWYLIRPSFRKFAVAFVDERDRQRAERAREKNAQAMRAFAAKQVLKEAKRLKE